MQRFVMCQECRDRTAAYQKAYRRGWKTRPRKKLCQKCGRLAYKRYVVEATSAEARRTYQRNYRRKYRAAGRDSWLTERSKSATR